MKKVCFFITSGVLIVVLFTVWVIRVTPTREEIDAKTSAKFEKLESDRVAKEATLELARQESKRAEMAIEARKVEQKQNQERENLEIANKLVELLNWDAIHDRSVATTRFILEIKNASTYNFSRATFVLTMYDKREEKLNSYLITVDENMPPKSRTKVVHSIDWFDFKIFDRNGNSFRFADKDGVPFKFVDVKSYSISEFSVE